jgi:hypothetical protein
VARAQQHLVGQEAVAEDHSEMKHARERRQGGRQLDELASLIWLAYIQG